MRFRDRTQAGEQLAGRFAGVDLHDPVVLALPRGGVPVAFEVADALGAPMDVFVARKIGAPHHPEFGIGAVAETGDEVRDEAAVSMLGLTEQQWDDLVERERQELERRVRRYRGDRPLASLVDRDVILVDDGLATGVTAEAALHGLGSLRPARRFLAVPACAGDTARRLSEIADEVVCVQRPENFGAVGAWYERFDQTSDEEVLELLDRAHEGSVERR